MSESQVSGQSVVEQQQEKMANDVDTFDNKVRRKAFYEMSLDELTDYLPDYFKCNPDMLISLLLRVMTDLRQMARQLGRGYGLLQNHVHDLEGRCVFPAHDTSLCEVGRERHPERAAKEFLVDLLTQICDGDQSCGTCCVDEPQPVVGY